MTTSKPDYCPEHQGRRVFVETSNGPRRFVQCIQCEAKFVEIAYKVGPGGLPLHERNVGDAPL